MSATARERLYAATSLLLILLLAWWSYFPGLSGGFLFDDYANLSALGAYGPVDDATTFWRYLTSGTADTTGRPLALLSFLLDAQNWPAEPYAFKRSNVLLHLANGALLAWLLLHLGRRHESAQWQMPPLRPLLGLRGETAVAWLAAALWLLHPLFLSTTLYIVQREAMLPATFALIGLCGFVRARARVMDGDRRALWTAAAWIVAGTVLATLSKGNGALVPILAWLVDGLLQRSQPPCSEPMRSSWRRWRFVLLILPGSIVLAGLAVATVDGMLHGFPLRPWTLGERLLTQPRMLLEYLYLLAVPRPISPGLFNDGITVSQSLTAPLITLPALIALVLLAGGAWMLRRRVPPLSLAVLFFLGAHLMESTVIPLELYFEHRNYLPALLLFWPAAIWLLRAEARLPALRTALALALPLIFALVTHAGARLWGDVDGQGLVWARLNPGSPRAQAYAAQIEMRRGRPDLAGVRLERLLPAAPAEAQLALNLLGARCQSGTPTAADVDHAIHALRHTDDVGRTTIDWLEQALTFAIPGDYCPSLSVAVIAQLVAACESNPRIRAYKERRQDLLNLQARIALLGHDETAALAYYRRGLDEAPTDSAALWQTAELASHGFPLLALQHLEQWLQRRETVPPRATFSMARVHAWLLERQGYWRDELQHMKATLQADIERQRKEPVP
jgi:hypothetical protein